MNLQESIRKDLDRLTKLNEAPLEITHDQVLVQRFTKAAQEAYYFVPERDIQAAGYSYDKDDMWLTIENVDVKNQTFTGKSKLGKVYTFPIDPAILDEDDFNNLAVDYVGAWEDKGDLISQAVYYDPSSKNDFFDGGRYNVGKVERNKQRFWAEGPKSQWINFDNLHRDDEFYIFSPVWYDLF